MAVERHAERKNFAGADQCSRPDDVLGHHVIERADPVVLAPAAPIPELFARFRDRLPAHVDIHILAPALARGRIIHRRSA
jgi:hypothetical protein